MGVLAGILSGSGTYVFSIDHPWDLSVGMAAVMALAVGSTWGWITAWGFRMGQVRRSSRARVRVYGTSPD